MSIISLLLAGLAAAAAGLAAAGVYTEPTGSRISHDRVLSFLLHASRILAR